MTHYAAYQPWQTADGKLTRRYYGCGESPEDATWHATHSLRSDGQWQARPYAPNLSDLHTTLVSGTCPHCGGG